MKWKDFLENTERCEEQYLDENGKLMYMVVTKDKFRDTYYLLDVSTGIRREIDNSDNPIKLRKKMKKIKEWLNG